MCVWVCEWVWVNVSVAPHVVSVHFHQKACTAKRQWHFYTDMNWIGYRQESSDTNGSNNGNSNGNGNETYSTCTYRTIYVILFNNRCGIDLMFSRAKKPTGRNVNRTECIFLQAKIHSRMITTAATTTATATEMTTTKTTTCDTSLRPIKNPTHLDGVPHNKLW